MACDRFARPGEASGFGVTAVVSVDLDRPDAKLADPAVVTGPGVVYASATGLYLTTANWGGFVAVGGVASGSTGSAGPATTATASAGLTVDERAATQIHRLDIGDASGPARYVAGGRVQGHPLNDFALDEKDGFLRVATTDDTANRVSVLRPVQGEELEVTGAVDGIAPGERIQAVRFIGDRGYVVTFRQVDPLFTLDLSESPRAARGRIARGARLLDVPAPARTGSTRPPASPPTAASTTPTWRRRAPGCGRSARW